MDAATEHILDDIANDVQAKAGTAFAQFGGKEGVEHAGQIGWRDAASVVADFDAGVVVFEPNGAHSDASLGSALQTVEDGVVDQVDDDLLKRPGVAVQRDIRIDFHGEGVGFFLQ